jgi:NADH-quinone oxidoreductase subunit M
MLWMYQRVFLGRVEKEENCRLPDLSFREGAMLIPAIALSLWMGIGSGTFLRTMDGSIQLLVDRLDQVQHAQVVRSDVP